MLELKITLPTIENIILNYILNTLDEYFTQLIFQFKEAYIKEYDVSASKYDIDYFYINNLYKLINKIEVYLLPNDKLISIRSEYGYPDMTLRVVVEREEIEYEISIDIITAGVYDIQKLTSKYVVKTKLLKTNNNIVTNTYKDELKKLQIIKKLQTDISDYQFRLNTLEKELK